MRPLSRERSDFYVFNKNFNSNPHEIDALLLSHAHIDYSGNIPSLVKHGFHGRIYGTHTTCSLIEIMLLDSGHIQESDILYLNKKRMRRGELPMKPLYTFEDAREALQDLTPVKYIQKFMPAPSMEVEFYDAGHILGSAGIKMDIRENETQKRL